MLDVKGCEALSSMVIKRVKKEKRTDYEGRSGLTQSQPFILSAWLLTS